MAAPAILGLGWLAATLGSFFIGFVSFLGRQFTKRVAITIGAVVAFSVLAGTLVTALDALLGQIVTTFPVAANMGFIMPTGFTTTIGFYFAFRITYWVYSVNWLIIRMRLM